MPTKINPELMKRLQRMAEIDGFLISENGTIRWLPQGLKTMRTRFARAGIDIQTLTNVHNYIDARIEIEPFLEEELVRIARGRGGISDQRKLLEALVEGRETDARTLNLKLSNQSARSERDRGR